jgi:subtilisin family serine protease
MCTDERGRAPVAPTSYGVTWGGLPQHARRFLTVAAATALAVGVAGPAVAQAATPSAAAPVQVLVREAPDAGGAAAQAVSRLGGSVGRELKLINGFSASVPADRLDALRAVPGVVEVSENAALTLSDADVTGQVSQTGSLYTLANQVTGASALWNAGATGQGVDIALVDSGVVPVTGLKTAGKVVYGPDLTEEASTSAKNLDTYGHGTHMAGIIAGRDTTATGLSGNTSDFVGMAPNSRIVSIKVADAKGQTDVSQAIAAIDWVVTNKTRNGLNIRVLNMSFDTDSTQDYTLDPLAFAAEQAWHAGIVVVVSVGNDGATHIANPATDPYLIAVGSENANGTKDVSDDTVSSFSNKGTPFKRGPDLVAPGDHVVSLRDPNSYLDTQYPAARIGDRLFRGSGTSQAAAVVSGAAALLISQRPELTPDQVKALLTKTAEKIPGTPGDAQGKGLVNLAAAKDAPTPTNATQKFKVSTGLGSLELSRGSVHVVVAGQKVTGETDVHGKAFNASAVAAGIRSRTNWSGVGWSGVGWSGVGWSGVGWSGVGWSGVGWSGVGWSGVGWSGVGWSGVGWSGVGWSGVGWSGVGWSGVGWSGVGWSGTDWA